FHHEHNRTENTSTCTKETGTWRDLTAYDSGSVMHYPHCNGIAGAWSRAYALTDRDRQGAANLYGAGATPAGQNAIDRSEFFVRQVYRDVLGREPDPGGLVNAINWLQSCNGEPTCLAGARLDFARSVFESQEHRSRHPELNPSSPTYKADYLTRLYTAFLRRQPDTAGYNWWLNALNASGDYRGTVNGFITASEFRLRFGRQ
ncbi:MAG TPA: DUF4214 domain-containing protein, partial [Myxococcaceae bacterium]|nr:DUF4214 domain-containing protein [Myxococcaceae bacterium]